MREIFERVDTFAELHEFLGQYLQSVRPQAGAYTLERMQGIMNYLGNPQDSCKVIHIAGTSGKTSTSYYIAACIKETGKKVGLTVSPYIDEINERVQINLKPLSEKKFCSDFSIFMRHIQKSGLRPNYFELLTAFAFWEFKRQSCEYVVVEVGLGGLLDATNVVTRSDKICVITDIGLDHEHVLGKDLASIAAKKAGIIKPYNTVVCYEQGEEVMSVVREVASQQQAELHEIWPLKNSDLPSNLPLFQRRNWYLALSVFNILATQYRLEELTEQQLVRSSQVSIPARMEAFLVGNKTVIVDGSHNSQKIAAFVKSLRHQYPKQKYVIMVSFLSTKKSQIKDCLDLLLPVTQQLIITTFATANKEKVSVDPLKIADVCESVDFTRYIIERDPHSALETLLASDGESKVITGSFYLLNHVRPVLGRTIGKTRIL